MKKEMILAYLVTALSTASAHGSNVGFDVNINVGNQPRPVVVPPPPVVVSPPPVVIAPPPAVVVEEPPVFIAPPQLGFYVAVGIPYDLFYLSGSYYLYRGDRWYRGSRYDGPWVGVSYRSLPPGLRRHKFERIRYIRDEEYRVYREHNDYRGRHFRPEKEWKERKKEDHERWKEEKREEREERKWRKHHRDDD